MNCARGPEAGTPVAIRTPSIKLDQFLKWANIAETGGQAKIMVQSGLVKVNSEPETRRGRTLIPGDVVSVEGVGTFIVAGGATGGDGAGARGRD